MYHSRRHAQHLKALLWGQPEGPRSYEEIPAELRGVAAAVDRIGDDLARLRVLLSDGASDAGSGIVQVHVIANTLADQVVSFDPAAVPDPQVVWMRREVEGEAFDAPALDAALRYYAISGEPNVFRDGDPGRPALRDVRAFQRVAREIVDMCADFDDIQSPGEAVEDFVRLHWSCRDGGPGLVDWELHPLGMACFEAVRATLHLPAEEAEYAIPEDKPPEPDYGSAWTPPASTPSW